MNSWKSFPTLTFVLGGLLAFVGCGSGNPAPQGVDRDTRIRLNIVAEFYSDYVNSHRGKAPQDIEEFREFLQERAGQLSSYTDAGVVESVDELLTSARDGQPFVVVTGKLVKVSDSPDTLWAAYEQQGVDGSRLAVKTYGGERLLSPDGFATEFPGAK